MVLSTLKEICGSRLKAGSIFLDRMMLLRPRPDGLEFASRPLLTPEQARSLTPPDKVASFIKARQAGVSRLTKIVFNNLSIRAIEHDDREKLSLLAQCQYRKFARVVENCAPEVDFEMEIQKSGCIIDSIKKELWTTITLNPTGQITNYELLLNDVTVGYVQFMEKTQVMGKPNHQYLGKLEVETAFQLELPENSAQVTDLSIDPHKILWALNLGVLTASHLGGIEDEIEDGVLIYMAGLLLSAVENPKEMFKSDVENLCTVVPYKWAEKMIRLGMLTKDNIIDSIEYEGSYYGIPLEYLRVITYNRDQLKETSMKMNYVRNCVVKEAI